MKVLLVSPIDPDQPTRLNYLVGGENTYTRSLLENPPSNVQYVHFSNALSTNQISYTPLQTILNLLAKLRILPPDAGIQSFKINDHFDLIHCHVYGLRTPNYHGPVVLSDSSSNILFLRDYLKWPRWRIWLGLLLKRTLVKLINAYDSNFNLKNAQLIVWSDFAKKFHQASLANANIRIIPPGIADLTGRDKSSDSAAATFKIVFIGTWFERKGGPLLLDAYRHLKLKYPHLRLTIIGQIPKKYSLPGGVKHHSYLPRTDIINKILPTANVLILVPPQAEGFGVTVLEAASLAVPAIVSRLYALPEIVINNQTGLVIEPGRLDLLEEALEKLIRRPNLARQLGRRARRRFLSHYSHQITNQQLARVYASATSSKRQTYSSKKPRSKGDA